MIDAASKLTEHQLQEDLPQHGYALRSAVHLLDADTDIWFLAAVRVGPSDTALDRLIADALALGDGPDCWDEDPDAHLNPLSPQRLWAEVAAVDYQRTYWTPRTQDTARNVVQQVADAADMCREVTVLFDAFDPEHIASRMPQVRNQLIPA